jgi:hypothetical protein
MPRTQQLHGNTLAYLTFGPIAHQNLIHNNIDARETNGTRQNKIWIKHNRENQSSNPNP